MLEVIQECFANRCLQEMWEQVEEDLAFLNIKGIFLLYVQAKCISIYNKVSFL